MNLCSFLWIPLLLCFLFSPVSGTEARDAGVSLKDLLPAVGELDGWAPDDEAQAAAGEDLFLLINGGAAIYHEYGFEEAVFQTYINDHGNSINLEIYKMDGQSAAYGIYTFKTGDEGFAVDAGYEGWFESYYLNFWEGDFLVTVTGLDTDEATMKGLREIAGAVDQKIEFESKHPPIISYLPKEGLRANGVTYLKGNLALFNKYRFDSKDVFGFKGGVIGQYEDYSVFIFLYENPEESDHWYESAKDFLARSENFDSSKNHGKQFVIKDLGGSTLTVRCFNKSIMIVLSDSTVDTKHIFGVLEKKLID